MPRCPRGVLDLPQASPQLGILGFDGSAGGGFPFSTSFGLSPGGGFLLECEKVLAGRRVAQPQRPPPRMERQPQHLAVQSRRTVRQLHCLQRNISTAAQSEPLKWRIQVLRLRVVQKILRYPQRFIQTCAW